MRGRFKKIMCSSSPLGALFFDGFFLWNDALSLSLSSAYFSSAVQFCCMINGWSDKVFFLFALRRGKKGLGKERWLACFLTRPTSTIFTFSTLMLTSLVIQWLPINLPYRLIRPPFYQFLLLYTVLNWAWWSALLFNPPTSVQALYTFLKKGTWAKFDSSIFCQENVRSIPRSLPKSPSRSIPRSPFLSL